MTDRAIRELITLAAIGGTWGILLIFEWLTPLRPTVEPKPRRIARNLTLSGLSLVVALLLEALLMIPVARFAESRGLGVVRAASLPPWAATALAILLLDYTLWWWHRANHHLPFLWRFHLVHHIDRDLDASTALRFHFGEHAISFLYRSLQVIVIGTSLHALWLWQSILFVSILFHHSNVRLPVAVERIVVRFVVTPRMHGIHHSDRRGEAFTNFSSILTVWDYLHRTILLAVPQSAVTIGVPAYARDEDVTIGRMIVLPFLRQRDDWGDRRAPRVTPPDERLLE